VPHSRYNDLPDAAITACGYRILSRSSAAGVDLFVRNERPSSLFVFFQGHPEYTADTLAREYRRDVGLFLRGERENFPAAPEHYFDARAAALVDAFRTRAIGERRDKLIRDFPMKALEAGLESTWRAPAVGVYENWIAYLQARKAERRVPSWRLQRVRGGVWRGGDARPTADGSAAG
jgi:homoserine O-succinyltransferase